METLPLFPKRDIALSSIVFSAPDNRESKSWTEWHFSKRGLNNCNKDCIYVKFVAIALTFDL